MRVLIFVLGVFFTVGIGQAFADTYEFYTYGGYDAAVTAWNRVALIFSDKEFSVLALTAIILGALILFYSLLLKTAIGVNISLFRGWMVPFIGSLVVVSALVLPKDKLVIYDPVLNRGPQEISGIPKVLALTAYVTNKVERAFIKIIDTLAIDEYAKYERNAGGLSYKITTDLFSSLPPAKEYFYKTAENYVKDCILFEIGRSGGGTINMEKLLKGEITFLDAINLARNPAVNTKYYNTDGTERVADCATAGNVLISYINQEKNIGSQTSLIFNHLRSACRASEVENVADCERLLSYAVNKIANAMSSGIGPVTLDLVWYQYIMTTIAEDVFAKNDLSYALRTFATRQTMSTLWGLGQHANSWIPVLKSVFTALAISISPFVILLMATPLAGRALMVLFGLYLWLLCWGVIDAAIFSFGNDFAVKFAPSLTNYGSGVGMAFAMSLPSVSAKTVAVFGAMRWAGLGLATFFTTMLVRFGGTVLALAAGQIASSVPMSSGASYGESLLKRPASSFLGEVSLPSRDMGLLSGQIEGSKIFGGSLSSMLLFSGRRAASSTITDAIIGSKYSPTGLGAIQAASTEIGIGETEGKLLVGGKLGIEDPRKLGEWFATGRVIDNKMANILASKFNIPAESLTGLVIKDIGINPSTGEIKHLAAESSDPKGKRHIKLSGAGFFETRAVEGLSMKVGEKEYLFSGQKEVRYSLDGKPLLEIHSGRFFDPTTGKSFQGIAYSIDGQSYFMRIEEGAYAQQLLRDYKVKYGGREYTVEIGQMRTVIGPDGREYNLVEGIVLTPEGERYQGVIKLGSDGTAVSMDLYKGEQATDRHIHTGMKALTGSQASEFVKLLEKSGYRNAARALREHLRKGGTVFITYQTTPEGKLAYLEAKAGGFVFKTDMSHARSGFLTEVWNFIHTTTGSLTEKYNLTVTREGTLTQSYYRRREVFYGTEYHFGNLHPYITGAASADDLYDKYYRFLNERGEYALAVEFAKYLKTFGNMSVKDVSEVFGKFGIDVAKVLGIKAGVGKAGVGKTSSDVVTAEKLPYLTIALWEEMKRTSPDKRTAVRRYLEAMQKIYKDLEARTKTSKFVRVIPDPIRRKDYDEDVIGPIP